MPGFKTQKNPAIGRKGETGVERNSVKLFCVFIETGKVACDGTKAIDAPQQFLSSVGVFDLNDFRWRSPSVNGVGRQYGILPVYSAYLTGTFYIDDAVELIMPDGVGA